jgi:hypothetical protein
MDLKFSDGATPAYLYSPNAGIIPKTTDSLAVLGNTYYPFDKINTRQLYLRASSTTPDITFTRSGWNYLRCSNTADNNVIAFIADYQALPCSPTQATLSIHSNYIAPGQRNNAIDIGSSSYGFKDLYLRGSIKKGSYTYTLPNQSGTIALASSIPDSYSYIEKKIYYDSGYFNQAMRIGMFKAYNGESDEEYLVPAI